MIALFSALLLAQASPSTLPPEALSTLKANGDCLTQKVMTLERSGASPDDLFKAAKTHCAETYVAAIFSIQDAAEKLQPRPVKAPRDIAWDMINGTESDLADRLRLKVLELRAMRAGEVSQ